MNKVLKVNTKTCAIISTHFCLCKYLRYVKLKKTKTECTWETVDPPDKIYFPDKCILCLHPWAKERFSFYTPSLNGKRSQIYFRAYDKPSEERCILGARNPRGISLFLSHFHFVKRLFRKMNFRLQAIYKNPDNFETFGSRKQTFFIVSKESSKLFFKLK